MADALRAATGAAGFSRRAFRCIWSRQPGAARARSEQTLATPACRSRGIDGIEEVPDGPVDRRSPTSSSMRCRSISSSRTATAGTCAWSASADDKLGFRRRRPMPLFERLPPQIATRRRRDPANGAHDQPIALLARRIAQHGGAALIIDYGHAESGFGDTLQAVRGHEFADPLADRRGRSHRAGRFRRARASRRSAQGARDARPDHAGRIPAPPRHRAARRAAEGERDAAAGRRHRRGARAAHRAGPDGRAVQGAGDRRSEARRAAGI